MPPVVDAYGRGIVVWVITLIISAPVALVLFSLGLAVAEIIIFPTTILATSVVAALVAAWVGSSSLAGDNKRTRINAVAWRNLAWAVIPAAASLFVGGTFPILPPVPGFIQFLLMLGLFLIYPTLAATVLTFRYRGEDQVRSWRLAVSGAWLVGTTVAVKVILSVASVFDLVGP